MDEWIIGLAATLAAAAFGYWLGRGRGTRVTRDLGATVVDAAPLGLLAYTDSGRIVFANRRAEALLSAGDPLVGRSFLQIAAQAPEPTRDALLGDTRLLTVLHDEHAETFQLSKDEVLIEGVPHTLLMIHHLTREVSRREVEVLKKVIRVIGHELNNSLASVSSLLGSARFIGKHPEHLGRLDEVLGAVEERAAHLKGFLSSYAELARLPAPRKRETAWGPLVGRLRELFPAVDVAEPPGEPGFLDETQIEQLLINLIKNALEAGGEPTQVQLVIRARDGGGWELRVLDRGQGFSEEALQNALLPFYTTKPGGSGMGLTLCREIADGHGGSLGIRRREGGGTAVTCLLPPKVETSARAPLTLTNA